MVGLTLIARERSETSEILSWPPLHILAPQGFPRCGCCPKSLWHFPGCLLPPILPHLVDLLDLHLLLQLPVPPHWSQVFPLARGWQGKRGTEQCWKSNSDNADEGNWAILKGNQSDDCRQRGQRQLWDNFKLILGQFWDNFDKALQTWTNLTTVRSDATSEITEGSDGEELPPRTWEHSFNNSINTHH